MRKYQTLTATDRHRLGAYRRAPSNRAARAGIVVVQEIFGVNAHIRAVCDALAAKEYAVLAPALFDRVEPSLELPYDEAGTARGRELRTQIGWDAPLLDIEAARQSLAAEVDKVGIIGFCWGGSLAWLSACRLNFDAAVCYYGGQIAQFADEQPRCPTILHFGEKDPLIPKADTDKIAAAHPELDMHFYPAGHGFNCDQRGDYHPQSADLAMQRSLDFFEKVLG